MPLPPSPPPAQGEMEQHRFPCRQCGADLRFSPARGLLACDHCGTEQRIPPSQADITELDYRRAAGGIVPEEETEELRHLHCPNCGADVVFDGNGHAAECPFCATPVVTDTGRHRQIKPQALVAFAVEERDAHKAMTDWLGRLWFAPDGLREYARKGRRMQGVYVPYWTFDADTKSTFLGERGTAYYVSRTVMRDGKQVQQRERRIRWRPVSGRVARFFDDVLVLAAQSLPRHYTERLEPWDLTALVPYRPEYLAGYGSEGYTVGLEQGYDLARAHMDRVILQDVRANIGGDEQRVHTVNTAVSKITFKHVLLPVWLAAYKYRGKTYRFVVNGQTGEVQGERPWSAIKIAIAIIALAIVAGVVAYFVSQNQ